MNTPDTLRALFVRIDDITYSPGDNDPLEKEKEEGMAHADEWETEQNEDIRRHEEWLNERNGLLERLEKLQEDYDGLVQIANNFYRTTVETVAENDKLSQRLEDAEKEQRSSAELFFQLGCVIALQDNNSRPAYRAFKWAKKLGHPDADEQLDALAAGEVKP